MAQRRMIAQNIVDSDLFLDMPASTQSLYFHFLLRADDDGFLDNYKGIMRKVSCCTTDLEELIAKQYIIYFDSGIIVIRHWRIHNSIAKDRYSETVHKAERNTLKLDVNKMYTECTQGGNKMSPQYSIDKYSKDKVSIVDICATAQTTKNSMPPQLVDVVTYCSERNNTIDPQKFYDYYSSRDWYSGKNKIKDWRACVRVWEKNESKQPVTNSIEQLDRVANNFLGEVSDNE